MDVMLNVRVGHDTDYLTEAVAKGREGYYTGAVAAGEPPGLWYGKGAATLGLAGEVDAEVMKALYTHGLDPRDPNIGSRETWGQAARFGNAPRNYRKADEIYAQLVEQHPEATAEELEVLRAQAAKSARQSVAFYDVTLSAPKSMTVAWVAFERAANDARAAGNEEARRSGPARQPSSRRRCWWGIAPRWTSSPRRPATPGPGTTAAAAASGSTGPGWSRLSSCSTTRGTRTRSCTSMDRC
ncbi:hypothetical protein BJF90_31980 [Pseudonocardia sp. CNS-004]|nr:hypothetical protein BJF90_31980 [Pseudonocardia sp. CNS-004]